MSNPIAKKNLRDAAEFHSGSISAASSILVGYETILELILTSVIADGHVLITGLPGLGKTLLVKTLAQIWDLSFNRIQFTPDLMPSDISGSEILQEKRSRDGRTSRVTTFQQGPVFTNLLLADEVNRTPPRTQSALLQAMEEKQVSAGQHTHNLPDPFIVMATQNPLELEGTFPLPEAQLDRFLVSLTLSYPTRESEMEIARMSATGHSRLETLKPLAHARDILRFRSLVDSIVLSESLLEDIVDSVRATRPEVNSPLQSFAKKYVEYGAGPRAVQFLVRASRARALLHGREAVEKSDLLHVFPHVLNHRLHMNYAAHAENITVDDFLQEITNHL